MGEERYKIAYEDDWLLVVDKPSGLLVIPTPKKETNTLTCLLNKYLDNRAIEANAYPCHRLDRETSGLVVYSKGKPSQKILMEQFRKREVKKNYIAVVQGMVKQDSGTIKIGIYNRNKRRSEPAITKYKVLQRQEVLSVLEIEPVTGRTNQIRIHLQKIGHPIVGESVYAFRKDFKLKFRRVALHASGIEFKHPVSGEEMKFESSLPNDMKELITRVK
jgi:23S rRNA pseudouridine1911/1915/1917 synthase